MVNWVAGLALIAGINCVTLEKRLTTVDAKPNSDGTCYLHTIALGETCSYLIKKFTDVKSESNLNKWNKNSPNWKGCSSLFTGERVCVSSGNFPIPKQNSDGSCYSHTVASGDTCADYYTKYGVTAAQINSYNNDTWGWYGCNQLKAKQKMCLSTGTPPKPTSDPNAECGPLAEGSLYNAECPLNACCSQYGYCGYTSAYCKTTTSSTGAPGTTGCISNCGYGKLHTSEAGTFRNIMYWLDTDVSALEKNPTSISTSDYDTVHYSFVNINSDLSIDDSAISVSKFLNIKQKKVASFGGADFSTGTSTYQIFRNIVASSTSRQNFANAVAAFVTKYSLDGFDIDWEYPAEAGLSSSIPDGSSSEGANFLDLIKKIKAALPSGKTLSVAIPPTYYYLKSFQLAEMQNYVTYFVLMAYDYHGTWDLAKTVQCHTDMSDITDSLKLLDKAGVKMWKVTGGIANYGRSFKLSSKSCTDIGCSFSGAGNSRSKTNSKGILADSEINAIASSSAKVKRWTDLDANCDIMVYDTDSWVGWPKKSQRQTLHDYYKSHALGGTATWVDNYF